MAKLQWLVDELRSPRLWLSRSPLRSRRRCLAMAAMYSVIFTRLADPHVVAERLHLAAHGLTHEFTRRRGFWHAHFFRRRPGSQGSCLSRDELLHIRQRAAMWRSDVINVPGLLEHPALFAFDMDSTLIRQEVIDELARMHGVYGEVAKITKEAMDGSVDFEAAFRRRVAKLARLPELHFDELYTRLELNEGVLDLLYYLEQHDSITCVFSGGFLPILQRFQRDFHIDEVRANAMEFADGLATGNVSGDVVDQQKKRDFFVELCDRHGIAPENAVAIGDGANDVLMLKEAGLGVGFHAKDALKREINNWVDFAPMNMMMLLFADGE